MAEVWQDFEITKNELDNIEKALKNEEFRKLLVDYCEEITDPASRKQYEEEITQLEKERGVEVTFINPKPSYVIKTSLNGCKIAFINVCSNENVKKPTSKSVSKDGCKGDNWSVPHLLSPPREDLNKKGKRCTVYDVIFHPDALILTIKNSQFRDLLNNISCEAVETNFDIKLDKTNLKFPKMQYKGMFRPLVIRKKIGSVPTLNEEDPIDKLYSNIYKKIDEKAHVKSNILKKSEEMITPTVLNYTTPKYIIKYRSNVDMQDFTNDRSAHQNDTVPKQLIVEVDLPLLKSSTNLELDVTEKSLSLISEKPSKYKLYLSLPYAVSEDSGTAKFDQEHRKLIVSLPVKRKCNLVYDASHDDSGVDSDNCPLTNSSRSSSSLEDNNLPLIEELNIEDSEDKSDVDVMGKQNSDLCRTSDCANNFLESELYYSLPDYSCHLFNDILVFTLHVKNVESSSLHKLYTSNGSALQIKFSSISPGFVPVNYAFFLYLPSYYINKDNLSIEIWDNNVVVQVPYEPSDKPISTYWAGVSEDDKEEKVVEEPSVIFNKRINKKMLKYFKDLNQSNEEVLNVQVEVKPDDVSIIVNSEKSNDFQTPHENSKHENIKSVQKVLSNNIKNYSYSESSGDELSVSPTKSILKMARTRTPISRSVSESSADDYTWSSFENFASVSDSLIPEELEAGSSMKKTVRFNDVVSQQLFRTNSSILGQKKKNQRKSRNKKRAHERRLSESENSESEDKKEKNRKTAEYIEKRDEINCIEETEDKDDQCKIDFKSDLIFDIDM